jgi:terminase small subunit / prophage DNA-packing protein
MGASLPGLKNSIEPVTELIANRVIEIIKSGARGETGTNQKNDEQFTKTSHCLARGCTLAIYSLTKAAEILGVHRNSMSMWISRGCPTVPKANCTSGNEWQISIPAVFEWRLRTAFSDGCAAFQTSDEISKDEADRRKAVVNARLAEIGVDECLRNVVLVSDAEEMVADFCHALRSGLFEGAAKSRASASLMTDPGEIREFFESEINRLMKVAKSFLHERHFEVRNRDRVDPDTPPNDE